jgi:hypothetical protein
MLGQYRLGVELHAFYREVFMTYTHDLAILGPSGHLETVWQRFALNGE